MKTFNITVEILKAKGACMGGMRDFLSKYPESEYPQGVDYQELLNACAEADKDDYAIWLMVSIGSTKTTMEVDEINSEKSVFFAGSIICKGSINVKKCIKAGEGIEAGRGIKAGWGIEAGEDFGIYAGLRIRISQKAKYAKIAAKEEPKNIVCGMFVRNEEKQDAK